MSQMSFKNVKLLIINVYNTTSSIVLVEMIHFWAKEKQCYLQGCVFIERTSSIMKNSKSLKMSHSTNLAKVCFLTQVNLNHFLIRES
jgi:hypothetical protein